VDKYRKRNQRRRSNRNDSLLFPRPEPDGEQEYCIEEDRQSNRDSGNRRLEKAPSIAPYQITRIRIGEAKRGNRHDSQENHSSQSPVSKCHKRAKKKSQSEQGEASDVKPSQVPSRITIR